MNTSFSNMVAMALLSALFAVGLIRFGMETLFHHDSHGEDAYPIAVPDAPTTAEPKPAEPEVPLAALLAQADADAGARVFRKCSACHNVDQGGRNGTGPNLWSIVGSDIAARDGFSYSSALSDKDGDWTFEALNAFLANPKEWAPGTKMSFAGLKKPTDRARVIIYLNAQSGAPQPLPDVASQGD